MAMVLVAPAVCALGRGLLRAQHHPRLHMRVRSAAIQRGAQAGAAGACVSAAPEGVPRSRRACKGAAKVAGKGTPLNVAHFGHIFANGHQPATMVQPSIKYLIGHVNRSAHTKFQGPKQNGSREKRVQLQNHFFSQKNEMAPQCTGAIARGQNRGPIESWGGQLKGPHGDCHTAQSTGPQLGPATQKIIVSRALGLIASTLCA